MSVRCPLERGVPAGSSCLRGARVRECVCVRERVCVRELVGLTLILSIRALFRF